MEHAAGLLYVIRELTDAIDEAFAPSLAKAQLSASQFDLLYVLVERGPCRASTLAQENRCVRSNVTRLVATMEQQGLVERVPDPEDGRARLIRPTRRGLGRFRIALRGAERIDQWLRCSLGDRDSERLDALCWQGVRAVDEAAQSGGR